MSTTEPTEPDITTLAVKALRASVSYAAEAVGNAILHPHEKEAIHSNWQLLEGERLRYSLNEHLKTRDPETEEEVENLLAAFLHLSDDLRARF